MQLTRAHQTGKNNKGDGAILNGAMLGQWRHFKWQDVGKSSLVQRRQKNAEESQWRHSEWRYHMAMTPFQMVLPSLSSVRGVLREKKFREGITGNKRGRGITHRESKLKRKEKEQVS
ncbi:unnamed protein product [Trifolium pratense]|uniref:Uncharacterized protein n=1 Tax=Trifolium pratense TaxID=57577 RepID=A0ACB0LTJ4_TRIPR|nr:unnamed protein product [Trifolium pratense]